MSVTAESQLPQIRVVVAPLADRAKARAIDLLVATQLLLGAFLFLAVTSGDSDLALVQTIMLAIFALPVADALCIHSTGATPGKRALGLGISFGPEPYSRVPLIACVMRSLLIFYLAPLLPLFAWTAARDPYLRGAHDTATGTWVHKVVEGDAATGP